MASGIAVRGRAELVAAFTHAERDLRLEFRAAERAVAEPVRRDAEALAVAQVPKVGTAWSRMRVGVTRRSVYVAPRKRGVKGRDNRMRRPKFGTLLMDRALEPALERNEAGIAVAYERLLDEVGSRWER